MVAITTKSSTNFMTSAENIRFDRSRSEFLGMQNVMKCSSKSRPALFRCGSLSPEASGLRALSGIC